MAEEKQGFYNKHIKPHLNIVMFFTLVSMGVAFYLKLEKKAIIDEVDKKDIEQRIPESVKQLTQIVDHVNEVPSDVENFKREIRLIKNGDTLVEFQKQIDKNIKVIDSFYNFVKNKAQYDSIQEVSKKISRDQRTEDIESLKREQLNIGNTLQVIQRKLNENN